jgi:hypothetical protein
MPPSGTIERDQEHYTPVIGFYDEVNNIIRSVTPIHALPVTFGEDITVIASNILKLIAEGQVTVTTKGTPVALPSNTYAKAVRIINNAVPQTDPADDLIVVTGLSAIDATATPPKGLLVSPRKESGLIGVQANSNEIYVDASADATKVSYQIYGI